jgi:hypothetical protein
MYSACQIKWHPKKNARQGDTSFFFFFNPPLYIVDSNPSIHGSPMFLSSVFGNQLLHNRHGASPIAAAEYCKMV